MAQGSDELGVRVVGHHEDVDAADPRQSEGLERGRRVRVVGKLDDRRAVYPDHPGPVREGLIARGVREAPRRGEEERGRGDGECCPRHSKATSVGSWVARKHGAPSDYEVGTADHGEADRLAPTDLSQGHGCGMAGDTGDEPDEQGGGDVQDACGRVAEDAGDEARRETPCRDEARHGYGDQVREQ